MGKKTFTVRFSRPVVDSTGDSLEPSLRDLHAQHGAHLPARDVGSERYQIRDLARVGTVWQGVFGKLRNDAPHLVNGANQEMELPLEADDRLLEKCHFLYREQSNVLVWQLNTAAGGMTRFQDYLSRLLGIVVLVPPLMNTAEIEEILRRSIYEISYGYDRLPPFDETAPQWNQDQFDEMRAINAGHAKYLFRASRGGSLAGSIKTMVREALGLSGVKKIKVRLTDESDSIDLFAAPLKDRIGIEVQGRYPVASMVFQELENAYDRRRADIDGTASQP